MSTQSLGLPSPASQDLPFLTGYSAALIAGPNDSSISRGDREDTGDNEARPDDMGSGPAQPTFDPTSFGGTTSVRYPSGDHSALEDEVREDDSFEIVDATDGRLGLTNIGNKPAEDWAADTGPTASAESED